MTYFIFERNFFLLSRFSPASSSGNILRNNQSSQVNILLLLIANFIKFFENPPNFIITNQLETFQSAFTFCPNSSCWYYSSFGRPLTIMEYFNNYFILLQERHVIGPSFCFDRSHLRPICPTRIKLTYVFLLLLSYFFLHFAAISLGSEYVFFLF